MMFGGAYEAQVQQVVGTSMVVVVQGGSMPMRVTAKASNPRAVTTPANWYLPGVGDWIYVVYRNGDPNDPVWLGPWERQADPGLYSTFNPVIRFSGVEVTYGNGTRFGRYRKHGRTVHMMAFFQRGTTTTIPAGFLQIDPPVAPRSDWLGFPVGAIGLNHGGVGYNIQAYLDGGSRIVGGLENGSSATNTGPGAWSVASSFLRMSATYEAAS